MDEIDDVYDYEEGMMNLPENDDDSGWHQEIEEETLSPESNDFLTSLLQSRGISDKSKIMFEAEDGTTEERDWNDLTMEELLNIINTSFEDPERDLDDLEIELINLLRSNRWTPNDFVNTIKQQGVAEYAKQDNTPKYSIDDLTDDELFVLDLQSRSEDMSDEELVQSLEAAKQNEALFTKQIQGIRNEYKRIEDENNQRLLEQLMQQLNEQYAAFQDSILNEILNFNSVGGLDLNMDVDDMNEIANFILSADSAGINYFSRALNDPKLLVSMAWWALKGLDALDSILDYFTELIKLISKAQYDKGFEDAKNGKAHVAIKTSSKPKVSNRSYDSIDDLD